MDEVSEEALAKQLAEAKKHVHVGGQYKHYKDKLYTVVAIALDEATLKPCVIYQAAYGEGLIWSRPVSDWVSEIEWQGQTVQRFSRI